MIQEYKKHIRAILPGGSICFILFAFALFLWDCCIYVWLDPLQREIESLAQKPYYYVVESTDKTLPYEKLYKFENLVTFSKDEDNRINVNTYIQVDQSLHLSHELSAGQVAISQKLAESLDIAIGDSVSANIPIYANPVSYEVAEIIPYASDLYDVQNNRDFSFAILGNDGVIQTQAACKAVYFLSDEDHRGFRDLAYSYSNVFDTHLEIDALSQRLTILSVVVFCILSLIGFSYATIFSKISSSEVTKLYCLGFSARSVRLFHFWDHLIYLLLPALIQTLCLMILTRGHSAAYPLSLLALTAIFTCTIVKGGRKYGRATRIS